MTETDALVREHAYRLWQMAGEPHGEDERHWLEAEAEIAARSAAPAADPTPIKTAAAA